MKPIIFYDVREYDKDESKLVIDKEKFEKLLEDTYQAGYIDGSSKTFVYPNNTRDFKPDWTVRPECLPTYTTSNVLLSNKDEQLQHMNPPRMM